MMLRVTDDLGALRKALTTAVSYMTARPMTTPTQHVNQLLEVIGEIDLHRPVDEDGNHREMHTPTCGCKDNGQTDRHHRNGHFMTRVGMMWMCETCEHPFDAKEDADTFACGEDCTPYHARKAGAAEVLHELTAWENGLRY